MNALLSKPGSWRSYRKHYVTADPASLSAHDHTAWFGLGRADLEGLVVACGQAGIELNERTLYVSEQADDFSSDAASEIDRLLSAGALQAISLEVAYGKEKHRGPVSLTRALGDYLDAALSEGYSGLRVVADNTPLARGSDDEFTKWLRWEHLEDRFFSENPVLGVCFFDRGQLGERRLGDLAALHPVVSSGQPQPRFRVFSDGGVTVLVGEVDASSIEQLRRVLATSPRPVLLPGSSARETGVVIDLAGATRIDHLALSVLIEHASLIVNAPPVLRALCSASGLATEKLSFSN